jgi:phage shock protein PspC (stress-responsive transcriptional regulator)
MTGKTVARTLRARLTEEGLKRVITRTYILNHRDIAELSPDELERLIKIEPVKMSRGGRVIAKKSRRRQNYWTRVKKEIHILICTNDKKYATLRRQFTKGKSQTALVTMICGAIADYIGLSPAVIMPIVAVLLLSFLEVGINAYCAGR